MRHEAVPEGAGNTPPFRDSEKSDLNVDIVYFDCDGPEADIWDGFVEKHAQGSPFHLTAWQRTISGSFGYEPRHLAARDPSGGEIIGVLPLFLVRSRLFGRLLVSTPQAAYGGVLSRTEAVARKLLGRVRDLARAENVEYLELRNFRNDAHDPDMPSKDLYVTFRQELFEDPEKNMSAIPRKTRAEIRRGTSHGLECKVDGIGIPEFFHIYSQSVRELGTPVFSPRLFSNGKKQFGEKCRIFSVHHEGKPVAAVWTLFFNDQVLPYYGGSIRMYNRYAVNNFMYGMLIRYGCENGYRLFDFGRSKKGTGSFDFKKRWGMQMSDLPYRYDLVRRQSMPDTSPLNPKYALAIRIWRRLPLWATRTIGPHIARHFI
jgi:FemAB-related protein (PEP-CTERM system-associated)